MAVTMNARWDNGGTVIPGGDAEYVVLEQPIAEYDNWFNYNIVADIQAVIDDVINKFDANTILKADTDNTPAALVVAEQTIVGRKTGNSIAALTGAEVLTLIGVEAGATADQTGAEIKALYEVEADAYTDTKDAKLAGIETSADVTDATNVAAASAVMDADFSATEGFMRKTGAGAYTVIKSNMGAAVAPTVDEDSGDGYAIGSRWLDTTANDEYICLDASSGAAVWKKTTYISRIPSIVTGSRTSGVEYQNTSGVDMFLSNSVKRNADRPVQRCYVKSSSPCDVEVVHADSAPGAWVSVSFLVPDGYYYKIDFQGVDGNLWAEWT